MKSYKLHIVFSILFLTISISIFANTKKITIAGIPFLIDSKNYTIKKAPENPNAPFIDAKITHKLDTGYSISIWALKPKGKEAKAIQKFSILEHIKRMAGQLSKKNQVPNLEKLKKHSFYQYTYFESQNPSGMPFQMYLACAMKNEYLIYIMAAYEKHRSNNKKAFTKSDFEKDFLFFLGK